MKMYGGSVFNGYVSLAGELWSHPPLSSFADESVRNSGTGILKDSQKRYLKVKATALVLRAKNKRKREENLEVAIVMVSWKCYKLRRSTECSARRFIYKLDEL